MRGVGLRGDLRELTLADETVGIEGDLLVDDVVHVRGGHGEEMRAIQPSITNGRGPKIAARRSPRVDVGDVPIDRGAVLVVGREHLRRVV